ncbi:MAG: hypothetical protein JWP68_1639 [Modestobacter sp.]|nr:hypothetical protein [Modestobacter sp.]
MFERFTDASRPALAQTVGLVGRRHLGRTDLDSLREGAAGTDAA